MVVNSEFPSQEALAVALTPRALSLIILPTEQCNFRCEYCYQDFSIGRMQPTLVEAVKQLISKRIADITYLHLSWFGGEPLLAKEIVFDISEYAQQLCTENGVYFQPGEMTTNGYLLSRETMRRLLNLNLKVYHISLDGVGVRHDATRHLASGGGTFERIWTNLIELRNITDDFSIMIRIHFGGCPLSDTEQLCHAINATFGGDPRFRVMIDQIKDFGGPGGGKFKPYSPEEARQMSDWLATEFLPDVSSYNMNEDKQPQICYAAQPNSLLVRADGRIGKCPLAMDNVCNDIGTLDDEGRLHIQSEKLQLWMAGFSNLDYESLTCPYAGIRKMEDPQDQFECS